MARTAPNVADVAKLVAAGYTDVQLAWHFGRGDGWAYKFRHKHGIKSTRPKPHKRLSEDMAACARAYSVAPVSSKAEAAMEEFYRHQRYEDIEAVYTCPSFRPHLHSVTAVVCGDPL